MQVFGSQGALPIGTGAAARSVRKEGESLGGRLALCCQFRTYPVVEADALSVALGGRASLTRLTLVTLPKIVCAAFERIREIADRLEARLGRAHLVARDGAKRHARRLRELVLVPAHLRALHLELAREELRIERHSLTSLPIKAAHDQVPCDGEAADECRRERTAGELTREAADRIPIGGPNSESYGQPGSDRCDVLHGSSF